MIRYLPGLWGLPWEIRKPIKTALRGLNSKYQFRVIKSFYDRRSFGNIIIVLRSGDFEIDVIRDRSQFLNSVIWNKRKILFDDISRIISVPNVDINEDFTTGINQLVGIINKHWERIMGLFKPDSLANTLSQIMAARVNRVMFLTDWDYSEAKDYILKKEEKLGIRDHQSSPLTGGD